MKQLIYFFNILILFLVTQSYSYKLTIALPSNPTGLAKLERLVLEELSNINHPNYGKYLSVEEINNLVQAPDFSRKMVRSWLEKYIDFDKYCLDFADNYQCEIADEDFVLPHIPNEIQQHIRLINSPLDPKVSPMNNNNLINPNNLKFKSQFKKHVADNPKIKLDDRSVTREVIMRLYSVYPTFTDGNVSVAAMEYTGQTGFSNSDLVVSQVANGVPKNPIPPNRIIGPNNQPPDGESQLDVQTMYFGASDAELWYEDARQWMYTWAVSFVNRKDIPEVVSISWGWDEQDQCSITNCHNWTSKEYVQRTNAEFIKILARGTTIVVSSGDAGSPGRTNEICHSEYNSTTGWNHINPVFPGGSPWVLSVGATYAMAQPGEFDYQSPICQDPSHNGNLGCITGFREGGTTFNLTRWTSGSGFTHWDTTPTWQSKEVAQYLGSSLPMPNLKYFNSKGRAYPDVAALGHNCAVYSTEDGGWVNEDGTSCSCPIVAGLITNLNAYRKSQNRPILGYVNPLFYQIHEEFPVAFNDITIGDSAATEAYSCSRDFGFLASPGWDPVSGLGSLNIENIKAYLANL